MPEVWTPLLIALVGSGVFFYGVSKTAMPVLGVLASPLLVLALTPTIAAGFVVPLLLVGDFIALALYRQHANWRLIRKLVPGVLLGFLITALMFIYLDTAVLSRLVGVIILVSVASEIWRQRTAGGEPQNAPAMTNRAAVVLLGTVTGITTMAANSGGAAYRCTWFGCGCPCWFSWARRPGSFCAKCVEGAIRSGTRAHHPGLITRQLVVRPGTWPRRGGGRHRFPADESGGFRPGRLGLKCDRVDLVGYSRLAVTDEIPVGSAWRSDRGYPNPATLRS